MQDTSLKLFGLRGTIVCPRLGAVNGVGGYFSLPNREVFLPGPVCTFGPLSKLTVVLRVIF